MTVRDPPDTGSVEKEGEDNELDREPGRSKPGEWAVWLTVLGRCIVPQESVILGVGYLSMFRLLMSGDKTI